MLKDLLKGRMRDITPTNRPTCFDSVKGGGLEPLIVIFTGTSTSITPSVSKAEIYSAFEENKLIFAKYNNLLLPIVQCNKNGNINFSAVLSKKSQVINYENEYDNWAYFTYDI